MRMRPHTELWGTAVVGGVLLLATAVQAATVTYGPVVQPVSVTNWNTAIAVPKWDPALFPGATLTGVSFTLNGNVTGSAKFESMDASPTTVLMDLKATITLTDPLSNVLVTVIPVASTSDAVTAFDGAIDFGGTSGKSYLGLAGSNSNSGTSNNFALFTGAGNITLPLSAVGNSAGSGAGNLLLMFNTQAGADASVTYTYTNAVPTPAAVWAGLTLLGGVGGWRWVRRRRA